MYYSTFMLKIETMCLSCHHFRASNCSCRRGQHTRGWRLPGPRRFVAAPRHKVSSIHTYTRDNYIDPEFLGRPASLQNNIVGWTLNRRLPQRYTFSWAALLFLRESLTLPSIMYIPRIPCSLIFDPYDIGHYPTAVTVKRWFLDGHLWWELFPFMWWFPHYVYFPPNGWSYRRSVVSTAQRVSVGRGYACFSPQDVKGTLACWLKGSDPTGAVRNR